MKRRNIIATLAGLLIAANMLAGGKTTYRVIAVSKADNNIISVSNEVEVEKHQAIYIPNAFTPNSDGLNDFFGAVGEGIDWFRMEIYDRWGELIFESSDVDVMWDGTYKGKPVQVGTYVYRVSARLNNNDEFSKDGTLSLVK